MPAGFSLGRDSLNIFKRSNWLDEPALQCKHHFRPILTLLICHVSESREKIDDDQDDEELGFEKTPKPMLPYSSLFIFGPTNP